MLVMKHPPRYKNAPACPHPAESRGEHISAGKIALVKVEGGYCDQEYTDAELDAQKAQDARARELVGAIREPDVGDPNVNHTDPQLGRGAVESTEL